MTFGMLLWTCLAPAHAAKHGADGAVVGFGTLGLELAGGIGGGLVGLGIGSASCTGTQPDCWSPLVGVVVGGGLGTIAGGIGGSALMPRVVGRRSALPIGYALTGLGLSAGLYAVAGLSNSSALAMTSLVVLGVGMPIGAGLGASQEREIGVAVHPMGGDHPGLLVTGRF